MALPIALIRDAENTISNTMPTNTSSVMLIFTKGILTPAQGTGKHDAVLILAHRGASADFPENTLEAFMGAVAQGADGVELDVMRCSTGELVVCHDERLDRLAGRDWWVHATPWWKLKRADVGS